jgi:hypothetical protein
MMLAGATVGTSNVTIDGKAPGAIVVKESANFSQPQFTATTTMHYDAATLAETTYSGDFNLQTGTQHVDVTVKPGIARVTVSNHVVDIPAEASAPLELIGDNLAASGMLVPALLHATGAKALTLAVLNASRALLAKVEPNTSDRPAAVPASDVSLVLDFSGLREVYWYDPVTYVVHDVLVPAQQAEFRLTSTAAADVLSPLAHR